MRAIIFSILLFFILPQLLFAQFNLWEPDDGIPVRLANDIFYDGSVQRSSDGQILFAWVEFYDNSRKVLTMLYDENGVEIWDEPFIVCDLEYNQEYPSVLAFDDGEWLIAWLDFRDVSSYPDDPRIYIQKINENRERLFNIEGIGISDDLVNDIFAPVMVKDINNGAIITWTNYNSGNYDIYAQHIDNYGNPMWEAGGIVIAGGGYDQGYNNRGFYKVVSDGYYGIILATYSRIFSSGFTVEMQRIDIDGNPLWTNDINERIDISGTSSNFHSLDMTADGSGGVFVTWSQYDYSTNFGRVYAQRINSNGEAYWSENGETVFYSEEGVAREPKICSTGFNEAVIFFRYEYNDYHSSSLYLQKISGDENINLEWNDGQGIIAYEIDHLINDDYFYTDLATDQNGGVFITWNDFSYDELYAGLIFTQKIDSEGILSWIEPLELQYETSGFQPYVLSLDENEALISWNKGPLLDGSGVQAQIISADGQVVFESGGHSICSGISGFITEHKIIRSSEFAYISWIDRRNQNRIQPSLPYIQKLDENGNYLFDNNGICLAPGLIEDENTDDIWCDSLKICPDGSGGIYAAWDQNNELRVPEVVIQHLDENGEILWDNIGLHIGTNDFLDMHVADLIPVGDDDIIAIYFQYDEHMIPHLECMRYTNEREPDWDEALILSDEESRNFCYYLGHTFVDNDEIIIAYHDEAFYEEDINSLFIRKFNIDGTTSWDNSLLISENDQLYRRINNTISKLDNNILLIWQNYLEENDIFHLRATLLSPDGICLWEDEIINLFSSECYFDHVKVGTSTDGSGSFWICYEGHDDNSVPFVRIQRFDENGNPILTPDDGILLNTESHSIIVTDMVVLNDNSVFIVWTEHGSYLQKDDIKFIHLDSDGNLVNSSIPYPEYGAILTEALDEQEYAQIIPSGDSGFTAIWRDQRTRSISNNRSIYAQKVDDGYSSFRPFNNTSLPDGFKILNIWPNPFNPSVNVNYQLASTGQVKISVYDILGREVAVLLNRRMEAGQHSLNWNSINTGIASGTYFLQIRSDSNNRVKKISLVK